jgi:hypothetical protein
VSSRSIATPLIGVAYRVLGRITDAEDLALAESVSMAMLVVLETLSPLERAVFVLREAFGMPSGCPTRRSPGSCPGRQ